MPRYLVELESGANAQTIQPSLMSVSGVREASPSRSFNGLLVSADAGSKQELANQAGVAAVYDDIQAVPQVADKSATRDFLQRVKEEEGDEAPPLVETEPATGEDK